MKWGSVVRVQDSLAALLMIMMFGCIGTFLHV